MRILKRIAIDIMPRIDHTTFQNQLIVGAKMLALIFRPDIVKRSFIIALIVGTVLNLINQGDKMMGSQDSIDVVKCLLTYLVPYCVSTYGAVTALRSKKTES